MAFDFGKWLPYLVMGGSSVAGAVIGSRASGKAGEQSAAAAELASETQLQMSREQIANLREIYGMDLSLNWPRHRAATESLGNLARGMGSKLPPSTFETSETPPQLPGFGADGAPGGAPGEAPPGDPLNPNAQAPIMTPPPGTGPTGTGGRTLGGMATGATIGSVVPGIGTAIGAGVGGLAGWLSGVFGGDQRIADNIVPSQNDLTSRIGKVGGELDRRIKDGSATDQDWQNAIQIVQDMRSQFYGFADQAAGGDASGARGSIDAWVNPMLDAWGKRATNWSDDWSTWKFDPAKVWSPSPSPTPSRQFGGPVGGTLSSMGRKRPEYLVGEVGEEMYVDEQGNSSMVGVGGPQMFQPPRDGYIVPNHELEQQGAALTLSDLGDGTHGMPPRRMGSMRGRFMGNRAEGGPVLGEHNATELTGWGWELRPDGTWYHAGTGGTGRVTDENTLVNDADNVSFNFDDYRKNPNDYTGDKVGKAKHNAAGNVIAEEERTIPGRPKNGDEYLTGRGWKKRPGGTWYHGNNEGKWLDDNTFYVQNAVNPETGEATGVYFKLDRALAAGDANQDWYTNDASASTVWGRPPGVVDEGEFIDDDPNRGNYSPPSSATHPAPDPFQYNPEEHGYQALNEEFGWQPRGDMPGPAPGMIKELNSWGWHEQGDGTWRHKDGDTAHFVNDTTMVSTTGDKTFHVDRYLAGRDDHTVEGISDLHSQFDPSEYGYQPFNEQFEFDTEDLLKDPGYQFRLNEGSKAVERKGASRGMLQSGRTLKSLSSWAQGLASQEYGSAYGRARGEHQMGYGQSADAYNRELGEFGMRRGQSLGAYDQALQRWGMKYGMYGDEYNRASGEYERERDEWRWDDQRRYGRTRDLAGI